ncbi:MAG: 2-hydroxy-3-keto-5-methylthiopentenyl-1-phosphate phosphatase [Ignavibacteriae bacterium]|nr:MAG: 2-hydroxy-3-keto-5-methylthiopentenyl-1-phosphate phosphatase [Ignavibacteriota bacterium]
MNKELSREFKIYIDFDGTITSQDIGEKMFLEFGNPEDAKKIIIRWLNDEINSKQVWEELCKTIKNFDKNIFDIFLSEMSIDDYFMEFLDYSRKHNFSLTIVSDGLDYYINKISEREGFRHLNIYSNKLSFDENNNLIPSFPYTDEECTKCANCKRNDILNTSADDDITIYIGDGWSDTCAAQYCDYIFAKKSLLKFCEQNSIPYYPFNNFYDVLRIVKQLRTKKKIKKRNIAYQKRKEIYMQG